MKIVPLIRRHLTVAQSTTGTIDLEGDYILYSMHMLGPITASTALKWTVSIGEKDLPASKMAVSNMHLNDVLMYPTIIKDPILTFTNADSVSQVISVSLQLERINKVK